MFTLRFVEIFDTKIALGKEKIIIPQLCVECKNRYFKNHCNSQILLMQYSLRKYFYNHKYVSAITHKWLISRKITDKLSIIRDAHTPIYIP